MVPRPAKPDGVLSLERPDEWALQAVLDDGRKRELQTVIQAHFKDWLHMSGNLRQVYDLARMEREEAASGPGPGPGSHSS